MKCRSNRSDIWVLGGIGKNSCKSVLDAQKPAKIKSRQTSRQRITVVQMTSNQSVCSQKSSITCGLPSDMNKTSLTGIPHMAREGNL